MRRSVKAAVAGVVCSAVTMTALPAEVWAGPMSVASPSTVGLSASVEKIYYRRYYRYGYYPRRHYRYYRYGYDPGGAIFAGAALGLMGAGIAAASRPRYYGYGWGGYPAYYGGWGWGGYPGYYGGWGWGW